MPVHDWTRVNAGIIHAFHDWITDLARSEPRNPPRNVLCAPGATRGRLRPGRIDPPGVTGRRGGLERTGRPRGFGLLVAAPAFAPTAESDMEFYYRKQSSIAIRHVSGDRIVAMIEIVSPGNKSTRHALRKFVEKAADLLSQGVHLLILDLLPPGPRDPNGIHAAVWDEIAGQPYTLPAGEPLTLVAYATEIGIATRAYVRQVAVGDVLPEMPLFLEPKGCVQAPLEGTYQSTFAAMPRRRRRVLEAPAA